MYFFPLPLFLFLCPRGPWSNVKLLMKQLVTPAYAIETGTFTLAPWQTITAEGIKLNTPAGKDLEDPNIYNGHGRVFGPDGQNLVPHPAKDFQGLLYVDVLPPPPSSQHSLLLLS